MARRCSRLIAALNRVAIGAAPRIGSAGPDALAEWNGETPDRVLWFRWRSHPARAVVVRIKRPWGAD